MKFALRSFLRFLNLQNQIIHFKCLLISILFFGFFTLNDLVSQTIPSESSKAKISNELGFNFVDVEYSRPKVNQRKIWDQLIPYGKVWRTGADYPTFITFRDTILLENMEVYPGTYSLYTIPSPDEWTVILSSNTKLWGAYGYTENEDVLRVKVMPEPAHFEESFLIYFSNTGSTSCELVLHWEEVRVRVKLSVNITDQIVKGINQKMEAGTAEWRDYWNAAKFLLDHRHHKSLATKWIEKSVNMEDNWMNLETYAKILSWNDKKEPAIVVMEKAIKSCINAEPYCPYVKVYRSYLEKLKANE